MYASFWPRNPAHKLTRPAAAILLVSFFRVSVILEVVRKGTHAFRTTQKMSSLEVQKERRERGKRLGAREGRRARLTDKMQI